MKNLSKEQIAQIITDPENQPNQFGKLIWNGSELVFEAYQNIGVAGIAPNMPDVLGELIAERWNKYSDNSLPTHRSDGEAAKEYSEKIIPVVPLKNDRLITTREDVREDVLNAFLAGSQYQRQQGTEGWISVEERLPVKSGDYLTSESNHGLDVIDVMRFDDYNKQWFDDGDCYHPTHWMPLPHKPIINLKP